MNKTAIKFYIFMCVIVLLVICASVYFSINLHESYTKQLEKINEAKLAQTTLSDEWRYTVTTGNTSLSQNTTFNEYKAIYRYNNIYFISYSDSWNEDMLKNLAIELFNNAHGEEIEYVARVELVDDEDDSYAGYHTSDYEKFSVPISLNNFFPDEMTLDIASIFSVIRLTGADEKTTIESMSRTLSHEYGHHFTQYYFDFDGSDLDLFTKYFNIRNESGAPIFGAITNWEHYMDNHMWNIQEIAAEDYVYLMGSANTHQIIDYPDTMELATAYSRSETEYNKLQNLSTESLNAYPHENPVLKAPSQVEGLAEYYYGFISQSAPTYTNVGEIGNLNMTLVTTANDSYRMTWTQPWPYSHIMYTLVAYDQDDYRIRIIKTVEGDETPVADFGLQTVRRGQNEFYVDDDLDSFGNVRFRIVVTLTNGTSFFSDPYDIGF